MTTARNHLPAGVASQMEELHLKRQRERPGKAEQRTLAGLVRQCKRAVLVRVQAAALLKQRGYYVTELIAA